MSKVLFDNANLIDGTEAAPYRASVLVEGNRIVRVAKAGKTIEAGDALIIDATGKSLMPGLIDGHTHLGLGSSIECINKPGNYSHEKLALISAHCARVMLDSGYTGAYSGGSVSLEAEIALKEAIDAGYMPGPRMTTSSFERVPGGPMGLMFQFEGYEKRPCDPDDVVKFVEECADKGAQAVKFLLNGVSAFDPGSNMGEQFYDEEIIAAGEAARRCGVWLTAHCYTAHSIKLALKAGFRILYHLTYADEEAMDMLEAAKDTIFVGPAPGIVEADLIRAPRFGVMASEDQIAEQADAAEKVKWTGNELRKRGIKSIPGGDYGFPWNPVGTNARDLELFVEWFGYTPHETIQAATRIGGELMDMGHELGLVKEGYLADLLLVEGDPTENISVLANRENLKVIVANGRLHKYEL